MFESLHLLLTPIRMEVVEHLMDEGPDDLLPRIHVHAHPSVGVTPVILSVEVPISMKPTECDGDIMTPHHRVDPPKLPRHVRPLDNPGKLPRSFMPTLHVLLLSSSMSILDL